MTKIETTGKTASKKTPATATKKAPAPTPAQAPAKKAAAQKAPAPAPAPTPAVAVKEAPAPVPAVKEAPAPAPVKKTPAAKSAPAPKKSQATAKYAGKKIKFLDFKLVPITGKRGVTLQLMKDSMSVEDLRKICREHPALNGGYAAPAIEAALAAGAIKLV